MRNDARRLIRRTLAVVVLAFAVATTTWVILTLVRLDRAAAEDRPEATHRLEREPDPRSWSRLASGLGTIFYVQAQRSVLIGPAAAFTIGGAWLFVKRGRQSLVPRP